MPLLSKIITRRWRWIRGVCSSSDGPSLITLTTERRAEPTLAAIPSVIGIPEAAALDAGYAGPATLTACEKRCIEPYIATGRDPHHPSWQQRFAPLSDPPPEEASSQVKMAYKRHRPPWAKPSTAPANAPSNRCSALSRRCWASASSPCAGNWRRLANGVWSVWPSI